MIILEDPLGAVSENSGKFLHGAESVLALDFEFGDGGARGGNAPLEERLRAGWSVGAERDLLGFEVALVRALRTAHIDRKTRAGTGAARLLVNQSLLGVANSDHRCD